MLGQERSFLTLLSFVSQLQVWNPNAAAVVAGIVLLLQHSLSFGLLSCTRCNPSMPNLGNEWLIYCIALFSVNCSVIPNLPAIWSVPLKILTAQAIYAQEHREGAHYLQSMSSSSVIQPIKWVTSFSLCGQFTGSEVSSGNCHLHFLIIKLN